LKKCIDEKGRLFGRINVIDLIIIAVIVLAVVAVGWNIAGSKVSSALCGSKEITYTVRVENVEQNDAANIGTVSFPDQMMSSGSLINGTVESYSVVPHNNTGVREDGTTFTYADENYVDVIFTCKATVAANAVTNKVGSQEVRMGKEHIVKSALLEYTGIITSVEITEK